MKRFPFLLVAVISCLSVTAQDKSPFGSSSIKMRFSGVPMERIEELDTIYETGLSISPVLDLRTEKGWGINYSPSVLVSGSASGIYMHTVSGGYERYGKKSFDVAFNYSHYFFTHNTNIPYSAISNELYFFLGYTKTWIRPVIAASLGFGKDSSANAVHDVGMAVGVSHDFDWKSNSIFSEIEITPSAFVNAGTNGYFSFLQVSKYISNGHHFNSYVKHKGKDKGTTPSFEFSNLEFNLESSFEKGSFSIHPTGGLFLPMGAEDRTVSAYAEFILEYSF